ncbi:unnamed protein product [Urochloa decumbens]|uniref:Uncharacterized protein n=1 Tax=Urochloa decumbens TaxID=240449 RepID=A0ABC9BVI4_9POAL
MTTKQNSSAIGMSGGMPDLGGSPAGQTPYRVKEKKQSSAAAPKHIGMHTTPPDTRNGYPSKTSQTSYSEKEDNKTSKKDGAYGMSGDVKY